MIMIPPRSAASVGHRKWHVGPWTFATSLRAYTSSHPGTRQLSQIASNPFRYTCRRPQPPMDTSALNLDSRFEASGSGAFPVIQIKPEAASADGAAAYTKSLAAALATSKLQASNPLKLESESADASAAGGGGGGGGGDEMDAAALKKARKAAKEAKKAAKKDKAKSKKAFGEPSKKSKKKQVEAFHFENKTPTGEKKDMDAPMLDGYHPQAVEAAWNDWWEQQGYFKPDVKAATEASDEEKFVMVIPPPNVTGSLHLGHALTQSIEDALARWHRMNGKPTLWLPGTDHAGIATQSVVEKQLQREKKLSRHDLGREKFVAEVWKWKELYGSRITQQLRSLGVSVDWSREHFTMDDQLATAVVEAFVRMFNDGIIYRDTRLVNWCCQLRSAISDIEVDHIDLEKRTMLKVPGHDPAKKYEFGTIISFAYKLVGSDEEVVVATTRLETMLGDVAVAVHPEDDRYKHLHGAKLQHPFHADRQIPIITDGELVDMTFGTGAVKITPAHDPNDFKAGRKNNLPEITVFNEDGTMNENGAEFKGMMRFDARVAVYNALEAKGLIRGKEDNPMRLGLCSRTGDVLEPLLKPQWWVNCSSMAARAVAAVRSGDLKIVPEMHEHTWFHWLDNIRDWCISRQLWWGHRIPAYRVFINGSPAGADDSTDAWIVARTEADAVAEAAKKHGVDPSTITLQQDEDVLDTWFSSGIFPFSTMGWPNEEAEDYKAFYPNSLLETGHDILFFWVARMVMMGLQLTDKLPFKTVYLHAMVRDKTGRKMSKSLGNVIDPMEVIFGCKLDALQDKILQSNLSKKEIATAIKGQELDFPDGIPECGADALRFGLLAYTAQGRDVNLDINRVVGYRHFCNKLWNATKFAMTHLDPTVYKSDTGLNVIVQRLSNPAAPLAIKYRWILHRLNVAISEVNAQFAGYNFAQACTAAYNFWLYDLCDYYLELIKPVVHGDNAEERTTAQQILHLCLDTGLRLLHPMMPFVTEELWQRLPGRGTPWNADGSYPDPASIMIAPFPLPVAAFEDAAADAMFEKNKEIISAARSLRASTGLKPSLPAKFFVECTDNDLLTQQLMPQFDDVKTLAKASEVVGLYQQAAPEGCSLLILNETTTVHVLIKGLVDPAAEIKKLQKKQKALETKIKALENTMAGPMYNKTPEDVQQGNTEKLLALQSERDTVVSAVERFQSWK